ncbi:hypothetical protein B7494_g6786 [Chlorociboria aeruginascens]|nr:hypothetical protein B7494_g6786 [Chlorociboria aeruginascens]
MGTENLSVESDTWPFHVIIIGAGAGGLLIAQGLKKNGISLTVYEKEPMEGRARDWGMAYFWSSEFVPQLLSQEILDKLPTAEIDYPLKGPEGAIHEYVTMRNIDTGEELKKLPTTGGRRVSRRRLRHVLRTGIDVQYNKIVTEISYPSTGVVVHFEDGTSASGSLVIGADGGGSRVRRLILGEKAELKHIPIIMNNFNVQYTAEQALFIQSRLAKFTDYGIHPKGFFYLMSMQNVPDASDPSTWYFQLLTSWHENLRAISEEENTSEGRLKILKELTADMAEPRKSAMAWVPDGTHIPRDRMAVWSPVPWDHHDGRVTLAGDAAHSMTYHRGQGLNNCINDAGNLVQLLVEVKNGIKSIYAALTAYGEEVVKRGAAEVELSMKQTMMVHDWENFMESPAMKIGLMKNTAEVASSGS